MQNRAGSDIFVRYYVSKETDELKELCEILKSQLTELKTTQQQKNAEYHETIGELESDCRQLKLQLKSAQDEYLGLKNSATQILTVLMENWNAEKEKVKALQEQKQIDRQQAIQTIAAKDQQISHLNTKVNQQQQQLASMQQATTNQALFFNNPSSAPALPSTYVPHKPLT